MGEGGRKPRFRPGIQHPARLVAVIERKSVERAGIGKRGACFAHTFQGAVLDKRLSGNRDQGRDLLGMLCGRMHRHATTDAVPTGDKSREVQLLAQRGHNRSASSAMKLAGRMSSRTDDWPKPGLS